MNRAIVFALIFLSANLIFGQSDTLIPHLTERLARADEAQLRAWSKDPKRLGDEYKNFCLPREKSLLSDMLIGALARSKAGTSSAEKFTEAQAELEWSALQLMMLRRTDKDSLREMLARVEQQVQLKGTPSLKGIAFPASLQAIAELRALLEQPTPAVIELPAAIATCHLVKHPQPNMPNRVRRNTIVIPQIRMHTVISENGSVKSAEPRDTKNPWAPSAAEAVRLYTYTPFYAAGQPVQVETDVDVDFNCPANAFSVSECP